LAELLTLVVEDFEHKRSPFGKAEPLDVLRELTGANGFKQADMLDVFGTPSMALRGNERKAGTFKSASHPPQ
jgi:hypothetical protein